MLELLTPLGGAAVMTCSQAKPGDLVLLSQDPHTHTVSPPMSAESGWREGGFALDVLSFTLSPIQESKPKEKQTLHDSNREEAGATVRAALCQTSFTSSPGTESLCYVENESCFTLRLWVHLNSLGERPSQTHSSSHTYPANLRHSSSSNKFAH